MDFKRIFIQQKNKLESTYFFLNVFILEYYFLYFDIKILVSYHSKT
jgi:hypothetical protein